MHLGKESGCYYNDEIELGLCPFELESLIRLTEERALTASTYLEQGIWRVLKDKLQNRFDEWRRQKDEQRQRCRNKIR